MNFLNILKVASLGLSALIGLVVPRGGKGTAGAEDWKPENAKRIV